MAEDIDDPDRLKFLSRPDRKGRYAGARMSWSTFRRFLREFVRGYWPAFVTAGIAMALFAASVVALPALLEALVDRVYVKRDLEALNWLVAGVLVIFTVRAASGFSQQYLLARTANRIAADVQTRLANHILGLDLSFFHKNSIGQIVARATEDVGVLNSNLVSVVVALGREATTLVGLVIYILWTSPDWFFYLLIGGPLIGVPTALATRAVRRLAHRNQELAGQLLGAFEEGFHAIRSIKAEGNEGVERKRLSETIVSRRKVTVKVARTQAMLLPIVDIVTAVGVATILLYGGRAILAGEAEPGKIMGFAGALMLLYDPLRRLLNVNAQLQASSVAMERIYEVLDKSPRIADAPQAVPLADPAGDIRFDDVHFAYETGNPVLSGVTFTVERGTTVAFVGASGSGKTSIFNLVARLIEPDRGHVAIGGQDLREVTIASLRANLALVAQDALLFDATIAENIAYGSTSATRADIEAAARLAEAEAFIAALPGGYDFEVGPRGSRLSGGQRQRIAIARALLRNSPILMLDEATSALDGATEARVQSSILDARRGRTTLIIAHRLSTVVAAEMIHVLDDGIIVESGRHEDLLARGGVYAAAWRAQAHQTEQV